MPRFHWPKVQALLSALIGLGTLTLGIVAFDAERLISGVDDLRTAQNLDHTQLAVQGDQIATANHQIITLGEGQQAIFTRLNDHEVRIAKLETPVGKTDALNRAEARKRGH